MANPDIGIGPIMANPDIGINQIMANPERTGVPREQGDVALFTRLR